ncbi:hypothetical protein AAFC00_002887 [Neodothiora populina]|uniref:Zn(2)-C6 fungal-type domain-containing protein n=1 Tax=Neodothiora populina TaxID=2781224 RepID=A0ABR3P8V2_9PEZI
MLTPTPPSAHSSSGASPDTGQFRVVRKRNRIPLSCGPCRHRKLKCNRGHPCDNCQKRGDTASCAYASPTVRKKGATSAMLNSSPDDMQNRIDRLESLVLSLMTNGHQSAGPTAAHAAITSSRSDSLANSSATSFMPSDPNSIREVEGEDSDVNDVAQGLGIMKVDNGKAMFASDSHWYAILADIAEVKNYFANHKDQYQEQFQKVEASKEDHDTGSFLFRAPRLNDKSEIIANFPTKPAVDRLVARYFNSYDPAVHIIHGPTFQTQYDQHWANPSETSCVFYALLYAIMTLSLQSYNRAGDEPPEYRGKTLELSISYRRTTAQCLVLADTSVPMAQMLEALLLHLQAEYSRSRDAETGVLMISCICVRMAMRMGYHRDPRPYPTITPFQAEMRRRVWSFVRQADIMFSFQFGLPSMIRSDHVDTEMPRNLYDDELHEDMTELPPSRTDSEITPMSYMIAKARLAFLFGKIVDRTQSIHMPPSYDEVMKLDAELREAHESTPQHLKLRTIQESSRDPANLVMERFGLELIYLKSQVMLHRRFIARGRDTQRYAYSRRACIDASMEMLAHQSTLHHEAQPGGRLRSVKWFISSLTTHDFLLAAMVVCLDLYHTSEVERLGRKSSTGSSPMSSDVWAQDLKPQMMNALNHCIGIWDSLRDQSMEAYKASTTLRVMLEKLVAQQHAMSGGLQQPQQVPRAHMTSAYPALRQGGYGVFPNGQVADVVEDEVPPEHSAAMTLGLLSSGGVSPNAAFAAHAGQGLSMEGRPYPASMAGLLNDPMPARTGLTPQYSGAETGPQGMTEGVEIDWNAWDSYVQGTAMDPMQMWSMNVDAAGPLDGQLQQQQQHQQHQQAQSQHVGGHNGSGNGNGVGNNFMDGLDPQGTDMM